MGFSAGRDPSPRFGIQGCSPIFLSGLGVLGSGLEAGFVGLWWYCDLSFNELGGNRSIVAIVTGTASSRDIIDDGRRQGCKYISE